MNDEDLIRTIGGYFKILEDNQQFVDIEYAARLKRIEEEITKALSGNAVVKLHRDKPYKFMDYISITGKQFNISPPVFATISSIANNVEIYPKTNGDVQVNFTFTKPEVALCKS